MANKIFFPPIGTNTFADNIVGVQITDGGGLTQGNFQFTSAIYEKSNRKFDTGVFSEGYTLENLKTIEFFINNKFILKYDFINEINKEHFRNTTKFKLL